MDSVSAGGPGAGGCASDFELHRCLIELRDLGVAEGPVEGVAVLEVIATLRRQNHVLPDTHLLRRLSEDSLRHL